ncbi:opine dehydrogenase [Micromonospora nigra]|uniref:Opine dehydrogenase n=1 Tax=Micromonospora nigra TaxID=145857 RepID=A0A1C6S340_9ACTN|nr:NAD/NADP octopine/nopaline dehydrogenase family protein [Micromonospora nigra]SCL23912.1 opine dehydrogenase [Micromonospora nigra]
MVGSGNIGQALAAHLAGHGHEVSIYARRPEKLAAVATSGSISTTGMLEGTFPIAEVTDDLARFAQTCPVIFIATVTTAYSDVAATLAPVLRPGQVVVLFSSKLFGSVVVSRDLYERGAPESVEVLETDCILAARVLPDGRVAMARKGWNLLSSPRRPAVDEHLPFLARVFPGLAAATNLVHRGVNDFGAMAHVVISYANLGKIDRAERVLFYEEGLSERTVCLLEAVEREFRAVAEAYDATLVPTPELLDRYYGGVDTTNLLSAMRSTWVYRGVTAPTSVDDRLLQEDVVNTLVPLEQLGQRAGVPTPMVSAMISLAATLSGADHRRTGRTLERLGLGDLDHDGLRGWLRASSAAPDRTRSMEEAA